MDTTKIQYTKPKSKLRIAIWILVVIWIISMVGMFFIVKNHVNNKDERLYNDICQQIEKIFGGKNYVTRIDFSGGKVEYEPMIIPPKKFNEKVLWKKEWEKRWQDDYGDLYKMYRLKWDEPNYANYHSMIGWRLIQYEWYPCDGGFISECRYYPYAVGYKKQNNDWAYNFLPSVQTAVDEAFDYFTTKSKSYIVEGFEDSTSNLIYEIKGNDYYWIGGWEDEHPRMSSLLDVWNGKEGTGYPPSAHMCTYMHNGYYKVFIAVSSYRTYSIKEWSQFQTKWEIQRLWLRWGIGICAIFLILIITLSSIRSRKEKKWNENLYQRLNRLCNPKTYMDPYDKNRVDRANILYAEFIGIQKTDEDTLQMFAGRVETELGISLVDDMKLKQLKDIVNPANFMKSYDPEKVSLANELYSILNKETLTYSEFIDVENRAVSLLH